MVKKRKDLSTEELIEELIKAKEQYIKGPNWRYGHLCNDIVSIQERLKKINKN